MRFQVESNPEPRRFRGDLWFLVSWLGGLGFVARDYIVRELMCDGVCARDGILMAIPPPEGVEGGLLKVEEC